MSVLRKLATRARGLATRPEPAVLPSAPPTVAERPAPEDLVEPDDVGPPEVRGVSAERSAERPRPLLLPISPGPRTKDAGSEPARISPPGFGRADPPPSSPAEPHSAPRAPERILEREVREFSIERLAPIAPPAPATLPRKHVDVPQARETTREHDRPVESDRAPAPVLEPAAPASERIAERTAAAERPADRGEPTAVPALRAPSPRIEPPPDREAPRIVIGKVRVEVVERAQPVPPPAATRPPVSHAPRAPETVQHAPYVPIGTRFGLRQA